MVVRLDSRATATHSLSWRLEHRSAVLINDSPLGLRLDNADLARGLKFESVLPQTHLLENYSMPHGKRSACHSEGNQTTLRFRSAGGQTFEMDLRAYDNGVAFRYRVLAPPMGARRVALESEETGFGLPQDAKLWCAPSDKAGAYAPAYETYYENEIPVGTSSPLGVGWSFPLLFRTADSRHWALITEAAIEPNFCGGRLSNSPKDGVYTIAFPQPGEGNGQGPVPPAAELPWEMPWRVVIVGDSPGAIVESTLVTDLNPPSLQDTSWIKPGRVAWSWWSDQPSPKDAAKQRAFIDFAAEMGWEYVLVDANWTIMDNGNIHDVLRYAAEKHVGILLWYNSGGPHNVVTEKPRDCLTYEPVRRFELNMLKEWGVKGIKVDFFQSDKQNVIGLYHAIMRDAAQQHIMVNFHGCTLPRGWERTYPHLMSMEAVRGEECYIFDSQYPDRAPVQNTILPFTRNAVGPMDYTPVGFSDNRYPHKTTWAHELALSVLFETGWLHFADGTASYQALPAEPKQFLKEVPVAWDDTRFVDGYPGKFTVIARRHGPAWYIAGISGESSPKELSIRPGDWLERGAYKLTTIADGATPREFNSSSGGFEASQSFTVKLLPRGGFVAVLQK